MKACDSDRAENIQANFQKALPSIWDKARIYTEKALEEERVLFPNHSSSKSVDPLADVKSLIQERFGVTLDEFSVIGGKRTEEAQEKIDRAMQKETLQMASK